MPHAAKEVATVRKRIQGFQRIWRRNGFLHILPAQTPEEHRREKHPHGNKTISNKNFKIKLDIFLREPAYCNLSPLSLLPIPPPPMPFVVIHRHADLE